MPDADSTKPGEKEKTITVDDIIAAVDKKVGEKIADGFSSFEKKLKDDKTDDKDDSDPWSTASDEEFISKKDLPAIVDKIATTVSERTNAQLEAGKRKNMRDFQAAREFPELNPDGPRFNRKFSEAVDQEFSRRVNLGKSKEDPDLLHDCASAMFARGVREGWIDTSRKIDPAGTNAAKKEDHFEIDGAGVAVNPASEQMMRYAKQLNIKADKIPQLLKKTGYYR